MKKLITFGIIIFVILVMVTTVPSRGDHIDTIRTSCTSIISDNISQGNNYNNDDKDVKLGYEIGNVIVSNILNVVLDSNFKIKNYFVINVGVITHNGEDKPVSVGLLGHVFFLGEEKFKESLDE